MIIRREMSSDLTTKLNPNDVEPRNFLTFCLPSNAQLADKGELNTWLECMMFLYEDLKWLLTLEVDRFWNQVLYDPSWLVCLDSFLMQAPRRYDLKNIPDTCKVALGKVSRFFLLAVKRMSMYNEDDSLCFEPEVYGEIIYESFVFDAAKLLDVCGVFYKAGSNVCPLIEDILENIFKCQPKYYGDIGHVVNSMMDTLANIETRLEIPKDGGDSAGDAPMEKKEIGGREAQDMMLFLYDMSKTLKAFIDAFPACSVVFFQSMVVGKIAIFCEQSLQMLLKLIEINRKKFKYICREIDNCFVGFVSTVVQYGFVKRDQTIPCDNEDLGGEFVQITDAIGQCPKFLSAYYAMGNVDADFETIKQLNLLDNASLEYAKNMLGSIVMENDSNDVVSELQNILPGKSVEFINKCIETYGPHVEVIMNNIMEGKIIDESEIVPEPKKPLHIPDKELLEDNREHVALLKATLLTNEAEDELSYNMYDDEYDDTYDSQNVGANDIDEFEELTSRRKFTIPAALRQLGDVTSEESGDEEEGEGEGEGDGNVDGNDGGNDFQQNGHGDRGGGQRGGRGGGRGGRGRGGGGGNPRGGRGGGGQRGRGNRGGGGGRGRGVGRPQDGGQDNSNGSGNNNNNNGAPRGNGSNRGRGRGGRLNQHRRRLGDKKRAQGMMPF